MEKNFELLNVGAADMVSILSLDEMDDVVGGDVLCTKEYTVYATGGFTCGCGYTYVETTKPSIGGTVAPGGGTSTGGNSSAGSTVSGGTAGNGIGG